MGYRIPSSRQWGAGRVRRISDAKRGAPQCGSYNDRRVEASRRKRANRENTGRGMTGGGTCLGGDMFERHCM